jgi:riboflavin biosynthesis pyrimidine reductase
MTALVEAPERLHLLWQSTQDASLTRGVGMPAALESRYGGRLEVPIRPDRPTLIANFVSTLDGVVALGSGDLSGGSVISGAHEPDRFGMAVLRAIADVVVVGAGTLRESRKQRWTAEHLQPALAPAFREWREAMGLAPQPTTVVVTSRGDIPTQHPGLTNPDVPVVIATSAEGAARLATHQLARHVALEEIGTTETPGGGQRIGGQAIVDLVSSLDAHLVLCEGGPHLLGELLAADVVDELFLTLAPQLVGRDDPARLGLVEGLALPAGARWLELAAVRRSTSHLFLRYRRSISPMAATEATR